MWIAIAQRWFGIPVLAVLVAACRHADRTRETAPLAISSKPDLVIIGELAGKTFNSISGALVTSDGRVVVSDDTPAVRVFSASGEYERDLGRAGSGPGEYRSPEVIQLLPGDRVLIRDRPQHRLMVMALDGKVERTLGPGTATSGLIWTGLGLLQDGTLLAKQVRYGPPGEPGTLTRLVGEIVRLDGRGTVLTSFGSYPEGDWINQMLDSETRIRGPRFFGWRLESVTNGNHIAIGPGHRYHISRFLIDGTPLAALNRDIPARQVSITERHAFIERIRRFQPRPSVLAAERFADTMPEFGSLLMDPDGCVWVVDFAIMGTSPKSAAVFTPGGVHIGDINLPPGFRPQSVGRGFILGTLQGEGEAPQVTRYRVEGPGCGTR